VLNVQLNRKRLVAVLVNKIHIFELKTMKILLSLDTVTNATGICALSKGDESLLAFPASATRGDVLVYDAFNLQVGAAEL
jgi:autophagy-related protein 18